MVQLRKRAPRNHASDLTESPIGRDAVRGLAEPEPHPPAGAFDRASQSAIVDEFAADGCDASDFFEHLVADEHASTGRSCRGAAHAAYPGGRVEQEKEKNEGRH